MTLLTIPVVILGETLSRAIKFGPPMLAVLGAAVAFYIGVQLRFEVANDDPFWLDELHTVWTTSQPDWPSQLAAAHSGNQSPAYFLTLSSASRLDPSNPLSYRRLSIACGLVMILLLGSIVLRWTRSPIAAATTIVAISIEPTFIYYATEARAYALLMLVGAAHVLLFLELCHGLRNKSKDGKALLGVWCVFSALLLLVHQTAILMLAVQGLIVITLNRDWKFRITLLGFLVTAVVAVVAVQWSSYSQLFDRKSLWSSISSISGLVRDYRGLVICYLLIPTVAVSFLAPTRIDEDNKLPNRFLINVGLLAIGPAILSALAHQLNLAPLSLLRYSVGGAILLPVVAGMLVGVLSSPFAKAALAIVVIVAGIALPLPQPTADGNRFHASNRFLLESLPKLNPFQHSGAAENNEAPIRMRFEGWQDAFRIPKLYRTSLTFVFPNLLEDEYIAIAERNGDSLSDQEQAYLRFPLCLASKTDRAASIIRPTLRQPAFQSSHIEAIVEARSCNLLVRGNQSTFETIAGELHRKLEAAGEKFSGEFVKFDNGPHEILLLFHVVIQDE